MKQQIRSYLRSRVSAQVKETPATLLSCFSLAQETPVSQARFFAGGEPADPCSEEALQSWFDPLTVFYDQENATVFVRFPHAFFKSRFLLLFQSLFERAARAVACSTLTFDYSDDTASILPEEHPRRRSSSGRLAGASPEGSTPFGSEYTFETFISNGKYKLVLSLVREVTRRAARAGYNSPEKGEAPGLLVLCGPHSSGKTHLLRAVANELFRTAGSHLYCATLSDLESLFMSTHPLVVRQELSEKSGILLDDFHYLARIQDPPAGEGFSLQEELCLLLDRFLEQGKPVLLAGVGKASDWHMRRGLQSRLETGLWTELPEPDLDIRIRYAQFQNRLKRLFLSKEQTMLLARHCTDIRRLNGVLVQVGSLRNLLGRDLSEQDILNIIRQGGNESATLTPQFIVTAVAEHCGLSPRDILGEKRRPELVQARQIAMYLCRELLGHSYPSIGRLFGGRDHSTVMHGVKKIKALQDADRVTHTLVTELTKACLSKQE